MLINFLGENLTDFSSFSQWKVTENQLYWYYVTVIYDKVSNCTRSLTWTKRPHALTARNILR